MVKNITLEQQAFMKNLIVNSYWRKHSTFQALLFTLLISICIIFIAYKTNLVEYIGEFYMAVLCSAFGTFGFLSILLIIVVYRPVFRKDSYIKEKKKRLIILKQHILAGGSFEDLRSIVTFKEFFEL